MNIGNELKWIIALLIVLLTLAYTITVPVGAQEEYAIDLRWRTVDDCVSSYMAYADEEYRESVEDLCESLAEQTSIAREIGILSAEIAEIDAESDDSPLSSSSVTHWTSEQYGLSNVIAPVALAEGTYKVTLETTADSAWMLLQDIDCDWGIHEMVSPGQSILKVRSDCDIAIEPKWFDSAWDFTIERL